MPRPHIPRGPGDPAALEGQILPRKGHNVMLIGYLPDTSEFKLMVRLVLESSHLQS